MEQTTTNRAPVEVCPLMVELRGQTRDLHTKAERHPVQAAMVRGQSGVDGYASYLSQMWHIHTALEGALARRMGSATLAPVNEDQFRADAIREDLTSFGRFEIEAPVEPVQRFATTVINASNEALLGMHYVLEGSTNGGRYIAKAIRKSLGLVDGSQGTRYLDPYGEAQQARWGAFCAAMGRLTMSPEDRALVVAGAEDMFRLIIKTFDVMSDAEVRTA